MPEGEYHAQAPAHLVHGTGSLMAEFGEAVRAEVGNARHRWSARRMGFICILVASEAISCPPIHCCAAKRKERRYNPPHGKTDRDDRSGNQRKRDAR